MAEQITADFERIYQIATDNGISVEQMSLSLGRNKGWLANRKMQGTLTINQLELIAKVYEVDVNNLIVNKSDKTDKVDLTEVYKLLHEIIDLLTDTNATKVRENILSEQEEILLLLDQMLRYGSCEERLFKQKAKADGFNDTLIKWAIDERKLVRKVIKNKMWLMKKDYGKKNKY